MTITLHVLRTLCDRYVPKVSRHPSSLEPRRAGWWWAHEIGHLLTADLDKIGDPLFGMSEEIALSLVTSGEDSDKLEHELRCRELAAMSISGRLLEHAGRADLASAEREDTDITTMYWDDRGRVLEILGEFRCRRLPTTRDGLERKLQLVVMRAKRKATR